MADELSNNAEVVDGVEVDNVFDGWDDDSSVVTEIDSDTDTSEDSTDEADQPEGEVEDALDTEDAAEDTEAASEVTTSEEDIQSEFDKVKDDVANQRFTLNHLGETKDVDRDEVVALAQKGMDYDRIRTERDALKTEKEALTLHESFLNELAEMSGLSVEDLMIDTKARLVQADEAKKGFKITLEQAKYRVKSEMDDLKKTIKNGKKPSLISPEEAEAAKEDSGDALKARRDASFKRFVKEFPEVAKTGKLPPEVWKEFGDGSGADLTDIYTRYENKKLRSEIADLKKSASKPKPRSTGSMKSNGSPVIDHDFDGWD